MNLAPKLQLVKTSLTDEILPKENDNCSTCAGSTIYQQAYLLLLKYEFTIYQNEWIPWQGANRRILWAHKVLGLPWALKAVWSDWGGTSKNLLSEPCVTQQTRSHQPALGQKQCPSPFASPCWRMFSPFLPSYPGTICANSSISLHESLRTG